MTVSFPHLIARNAHSKAQDTAIICEDRVTTWSELHRRCNALAGAFAGLGLVPGDRVGFANAKRQWLFGDELVDFGSKRDSPQIV